VEPRARSPGLQFLLQRLSNQTLFGDHSFRALEGSRSWLQHARFWCQKVSSETEDCKLHEKPQETDAVCASDVSMLPYLSNSSLHLGCLSCFKRVVRSKGNPAATPANKLPTRSQLFVTRDQDVFCSWLIQMTTSSVSSRPSSLVHLE
jgi:hypothetical protein